MLGASSNTTFALDAMQAGVHLFEMHSTREILDALKARGVQQTKIAEVLGIAQSNVSTLFNPTKRTGKPRDLSYDEGVKLIREFSLTVEDEGEAPWINEAWLARLLHALGPSLPTGGMSEKAAESLAVALKHGLELLQGIGATDPTDREIGMAARATLSRFREAGDS